MPIGVVLDINVLVGAVLGGRSTFTAWPTVPPRSPNACADCVGIVNDADEFALWLSPHVLDNVARVLRLAGLTASLCEDYLDVLAEVATASSGGVLDPPRVVHDCPDHEDNLIVDLAVATGSLVVVSDDTDLTAMSPWHGIPILRPREFADRTDAARRARRRRR